MPTENNEEYILQKNARLMTRATIASVCTGSFLAIIKLIAYLLTGSVALLTSLVDSVLDIIASVVNMFAVKHSLVPADEEHRFGHGKVESLAGLAQAAFISGSAMFVLVEAFNRIFSPSPLSHGPVGIGVMLVSIVLTIILVQYQRYVIRKTASVAIIADSLHYVSDVLFNVSVIFAIILSYYYDFVLADPIFAIIIAIFIIVSAWKIARNSLDQLMDRELPDEDREKIKQIALAHTDVLDIHDFRTRASGQDIFIQLHLVMDRNLDLEKAHQIAVEVDKNICAAFPHADVIIHEDPDSEEPGS